MANKENWNREWYPSAEQRQAWGALKRQQDLSERQYGLLSGQGDQCSWKDKQGLRCKSAAMQGGYYCKAHAKLKAAGEQRD